MGPFGSDIKVEYFVDKGVPVLNGSNISGFKVTDDFHNYVTEERANGYRKAIAVRGDIVITHRGTLGQIAYVPDDSQYEKYVISQSQFKVRLDTDKVNPVYFTYYFHTNEGQQRLLSFKSHVGVPALAQATTNFRLLDFPLIPKPKQDAIASVLKILDQKIELNNQINAELEAMAKTLYDYWFVQFDFPDADGKPYKSSGGKMVYNKVLKREIPEGWELFSVSDLVDIKTGKEDANFAVEYGDYHFFTCGETNLRCNSYAFEGKAILLAGNGSFSVKKYKGKFNAYQRTYVLIPEDSLFGILYFTVKDRVNSFVAGSRGSIVKFITKGDIESIYISLPKNKILEFAKVLNTLLDKSSSLYEENIRLEELRDWLLPMLMNGQVTVK